MFLPFHLELRPPALTLLVLLPQVTASSVNIDHYSPITGSSEPVTVPDIRAITESKLKGQIWDYYTTGADAPPNPYCMSVSYHHHTLQTVAFNMSQSEPEFTIYSYFRSSCSGRLRIALNLKELPYQSIYVNLLEGEQKSKEYAAVNPSGLVPTLRHLKAPGGSAALLTQSMAMLEYLEEVHPDKSPLLPSTSDPVRRAEVRELANIIACDVQPPTNLRILSRINDLGGSKEAWAKNLMTEGLEAYERRAAKSSGRYSVGDNVTLADVCLVPAIWGALRFGVDLDALPTVKRVYEALNELHAVKKAHWKTQEDTPESLRE